MKKRPVLIALVVLITFLFVSCGSSKSTKPSTNSAPAQKAGASMSTEAVADQSVKKKEATTAQDNANVDDSTRKVIQNANVSLDVKDIATAYNLISDKTKLFGGYIANSSTGSEYSQITARIPSKNLDDFLKYLDTLGDRKELSTSSDDITDQYYDAQSRLRNYKAQEEQLLTIMKKATTIEETLKVQDELYKVRGEIEALEGKISMWDKLVELSTVNVRLAKIQEISGKDVKFKFISLAEIGKGISNGFKSTLNFVIKFLSSIVIVMISAIPVLPFIGIPLWLILRRKKKNQKNIAQ